MGAHAEQGEEHQRQVAQQEARRADRHDDDLGQLDRADQRVLGELLAELAAQRGEQEERQDEQQCAEVDQHRAVAADAELEEDGEDQRLLEDVVVERAEQLGDEERQETPGAQQGELRMLAHDPLYLCRGPFGRPLLDCRKLATSHRVGRNSVVYWVPACAGMTVPILRTSSFPRTRESIQTGNCPSAQRSRKKIARPPRMVASRWRVSAAIRMVARPASK
ncbi:hypothetical protein D9M68_248580 [compost metagenome]